MYLLDLDQVDQGLDEMSDHHQDWQSEIIL